MSHVTRKPGSRVSYQVREKAGCTYTEDKRCEILDLERRGIVLSIYVAKTKALICAFVFAYAKIRFSHDTAQIIVVMI